MRSLRGFNDQCELHGRRSQFYRRLRIRVLRAIDDERPLHEIVEFGGAEAETVPCHVADESSAGFVIRIVQFAPAGVALEMFGIRGVEEGALVMIEPPGETRIARIL